MKLNIVPARTGIQWVKLGIQTFFKQPLALAGLFFMFFMAFALLSVVPVVGGVAASVLMPAATLGMMVATEHAAQGRFPMPSVLLSAFRAGRQRARAMLLLGAVNVVASLALLMLVMAFTGTPQPSPEGTTQADIDAAMMKAAPSILAYTVLQFPLMVLFAQAPALVHWHGVSPMKSLFFSAVALWRNLGAFAMFGLTWMVVLFGMVLVITLIYAALGAGVTLQASVPVALFMGAMMSTSIYFTFRDIFVPTPEEDPPTTGETP